MQITCAVLGLIARAVAAVLPDLAPAPTEPEVGF